MKNTKYLFDERQTPEGMISVSQLQSFLSCKKKWEYGYIEEITPRVDRAYLTIGKLCHKGMQAAMQYKWKFPQASFEQLLEQGTEAIKTEHDKYMLVTPLLDEELPDMDQMLKDALSVFSQAFEEFEPWKYEVVSILNKRVISPALELHFRVPCLPTRGMHGYIDAILRDTDTGFVWCTDYKFRKTLSPDEDEAYNIQNAVYAYACQKMGIEITGTMTWQHVNTPAAEPQLLKSGAVSRAKIKTTWKKYAQFCLDHGVFPWEYREEMQEKLADIEWYRATYEYRNSDTVDHIWSQCVLPVAKAIKTARNASAVNFRSMYPWNCKMCQYKSLCQGELRGYDTDAIRTAEYTKRSHVQCGNKPIDEDVASVV